MRLISFLAFSFCLTSLLGCGGKPANYPELGEVTGTVTLDGQPLAEAKIVFVPTDGKTRASSGTTDASGEYSLLFAEDVMGAGLGTSRVEIVKKIPDPTWKPDPDAPADLEQSPAKINMVPERYHGADSELSASVVEGTNTFDFELKSD